MDLDSKTLDGRLDARQDALLDAPQDRCCDESGDGHHERHEEDRFDAVGKLAHALTSKKVGLVNSGGYL